MTKRRFAVAIASLSVLGFAAGAVGTAQATCVSPGSDMEICVAEQRQSDGGGEYILIGTYPNGSEIDSFVGVRDRTDNGSEAPADGWGASVAGLGLNVPRI